MTHFTAITGLVLALLVGAPSAHAHKGKKHTHEDLDAKKKEPKIKVLPFRLETRASLRDRTTPGFVQAFAIQPWHNERFMLETAAAIQVGSSLGFVGPWRMMGSADFTVEPAIKLSPMLNTGPVAGVAYRFYRQQFTGIHEHWTGLVGWRANAALLRARTWSVEFTGRVTYDSVKTELVLATSNVHDLSPVEGQLGIRIVFGHGRSKE